MILSWRLRNVFCSHSLVKGLDESSRYNQNHFKSRLDEEGKTMVYSNHRGPSIWQICLPIVVAHDDTVELFVVPTLSRNRMFLEWNNYTCSGWINTFIKIERSNVISMTPADNNYMFYSKLQEFNKAMCNALEIVVCPFVLFFLNVVLCPSFSRFWLPIWYLQTLL